MVLGLRKFDIEFFDNYNIKRKKSQTKTKNGIKGSILVRSRCKKNENSPNLYNDKLLTILPVYNETNKIEKVIIQEIDFFENMNNTLEQIFFGCYEISSRVGDLEKFIKREMLQSSSKLHSKVLISSQSLKNTAETKVFQYSVSSH